MLIENQAGNTRRACYFEAHKEPNTLQPIFGKVLAFYEVVHTNHLLVIYHPLANAHQVLKRWRGAWSSNIEVLPVILLHAIIGILELGKCIYILRKHPGLDLLKSEETGKDDAADSTNDIDISAKD